MTKVPLPIPIYKLALLQAYLYQAFTFEKHCENNFQNTKWYLNENFTQEEIQEILNFFNQIGLKCDCDVINNLNLKNLTAGMIEFHH